MAQGLVRYTNPKVAATVDEVKRAYANMRRMMDAMTVIFNVNTNMADVAAEVGALAVDQGDAGAKAWSNLTDAMTALTTANTALSNMDKNAT
jgi:hypothetical protein